MTTLGMAQCPHREGSMVSYVVAGWTATVDSKVARELLAQGQQVRVLTRILPPRHAARYRPDGRGTARAAASRMLVPPTGRHPSLAIWRASPEMPGGRLPAPYLFSVSAGSSAARSSPATADGAPYPLASRRQHCDEARQRLRPASCRRSADLMCCGRRRRAWVQSAGWDAATAWSAEAGARTRRCTQPPYGLASPGSMASRHGPLPSTSHG
jgi:hypothetical protein